jgi:DedD protein
MADAPDINVDELRRRARRRLIGAVVLALAAAVIVPMLLESDPKPLGEDVSVKIPPEDGGKFVNRLSDKSAKPAAAAPAAKSEPTKDAKQESAKEANKEPARDANREPPKEAPKADVSPAPASPQEAPPAVSNVPAPKKSISQAEQKMLGTPAKPAPTASSPAVAPVPAPAPAPAAAPASTSAPSAATPAAANKDAGKAAGGDSYSVQLAAFADDKGANALANKLKRATYPAYTEPLTTSKGTLWRVRVGPYPSRDAAVESRDKLKSEGYSGIVAVAK